MSNPLDSSMSFGRKTVPRKPTKKHTAKKPPQQPSVPTEHGRFDYSAIIDRPRLSWPNGARVAVWVIPNIEHFLFDRPGTSISSATTRLVDPDVLNYSWRDYGVRVGIWRMMEMMERYGVKGTVALNADVCRHYPRIIEEGKKLDWEWMGHGTNNSTLINAQAEPEERALVREVVETIAKGTGKAPARLARPGAQRNRAHARYSRRERHRLCRQLGQ